MHRTIVALLLGCFVASSIAANILFTSEHVTNLNAYDSHAVQLLQGQGHTLTMVATSELHLADLDGVDLVFVSTLSDHQQPQAAYSVRSTTAPVFHCEFGWWTNETPENEHICGGMIEEFMSFIPDAQISLSHPIFAGITAFEMNTTAGVATMPLAENLLVLMVDAVNGYPTVMELQAGEMLLDNTTSSSHRLYFGLYQYGPGNTQLDQLMLNSIAYLLSGPPEPTTSPTTETETATATDSTEETDTPTEDTATATASTSATSSTSDTSETGTEESGTTEEDNSGSETLKIMFSAVLAALFGVLLF